jgi:hypothetical protein
VSGAVGQASEQQASHARQPLPFRGQGRFQGRGKRRQTAGRVEDAAVAGLLLACLTDGAAHINSPGRWRGFTASQERR